MGRPRPQAVRRILIALALVFYAAYFSAAIPGFSAPASALPQLCIAALMALAVWLPFSSGQLSLAQAGFMALGAYGSAWLTVQLDWPFGAALPAAAFGTALVGLAASFPALRLRGIYLAVATLGLGEVIRIVFVNLEVTGGAFGFSGIGGYTRLWQLALALALVAAVLFGLMRGRAGRAIAAVRHDVTVAAALGIDVTRVRVLTFTLGAFVAGMAGAFQAHYVRFITPDNYDLAALVDWLTMMVLGGFQTFVGPIAGTLVIGSLPDLLHGLSDWRLSVDAVLLIVLLVLRPQGIVTRDLLRFRFAPAALPLQTTSPLPPPPDDRRTDDVLVVRGLTKRFGGISALDRVDVAVRRHSIHAIIGPNGAGKTTLFNVITGLYAADAGTVQVNGTDIGRLTPQAVTRRGVSRTFQNIRIFGHLSVLENVMLGAHVRMRSSALACALWLDREDERSTAARALQLLQLMDLAQRADEPAGNLPYGDQRRLELARALATGPSVLLLDEPAAGMNKPDAARLATIIRQVRRQFDVTVVLIDHDMDFVMTLCDAVTVLNFGRVIAAGPPAAIQRDDQVAIAYLGTPAARGSAAS